ncbi:MAG: hypothetical protein J0L93_00420 [Deltaproteobacteria bacterium]|nr:hypothetical protein [Deltaproteobacteria bacterium]
MSKTFRSFIFILLFFESSYASIYLEKLSEYKNNIHTQLGEIVIPQIQSSSLTVEQKDEVRGVLKRFGVQIDRITEEFKSLYQKTYYPPSSGEVLQSTVLQRREEQFAIQVERVFRDIFHLLNDLEKPDRWKIRMQSIESEVSDLEHSQMKWKMSIDLKLWMQQFFPIRRERFFQLAQAATNLLPLPWKTTQLERLEKISLKNFLRKDTAIEISGVDKNKIASDPSILLLAINHEHGIFELKLAIELLRQYGADKIFLLTARHAWPKYAKNKKQEFSLIFPEDGDPAKQLEARLQNSNRVGVIVCPEGLLPHTHTWFPLSVKPGIFVMARRLAVRLADRVRVYFVPTKYNGLEVLTSEEKVSVRVDVKDPEKVPSDAISKPDEWVNSRRLFYENWINETRGGYIQIDLVHRTYVPETDLPVARPLQYCVAQLKKLLR